jgi:hypothetical protein
VQLVTKIHYITLLLKIPMLCYYPSCYTTFPIAISEYGRVEAYGRDEKLVETVKNAIERLICRHGRREGKYDYPFLALSPIIINGNPPISKKGEILK